MLRELSSNEVSPESAEQDLGDVDRVSQRLRQLYGPCVSTTVNLLEQVLNLVSH